MTPVRSKVDPVGMARVWAWELECMTDVGSKARTGTRVLERIGDLETVRLGLKTFDE